MNKKTIHVRLPEVLAGKLERFASVQGMKESEVVRQALRAYFTLFVDESNQLIAGALGVVRPETP